MPLEFHLYSVSLRPTETEGLFNFIIAGKNINKAEISATHDSVRDCFRRNTGNRKDIKFGEMPWMSYYVWVPPSIRCCLPSSCDDDH